MAVTCSGLVWAEEEEEGNVTLRFWGKTTKYECAPQNGRKDGWTGAAASVAHARAASCPFAYGRVRAKGEGARPGVAAAGRSAKRAMRHFGPWKVVTTEKSSIFYGATPSFSRPRSLLPSFPPLKQAARSRLPAATAAAGADCEMRVDIIKKPLSQNQTAPPSPSSLCSTLDHMWGSA